MSSASPSSPSSSAKKKVILLALTTALCLLGDSMLYILLPIFWPEWGLSGLWEVGILLSVNRFVRLPLNPLVGRLYQKIPLQAGLYLAVLLAAATTIGYGMAHGLWIWILLRACWGLAWSLLRVGGLQYLVQYSEERTRGEWIGTYNGLYRLGSLVGVLFGGIGATVIGHRGIAIFFGIGSLFGLALLAFGFAKRERVEEPVAGTEEAPATQAQAAATQASQAGKDSTASTKLDPALSLRPRWDKQLLLILASGFTVAMVFQGLVTSSLSHFVTRNIGTLSLWGLALTAATCAGLIQSARWCWEPFLASRIGRWSDGPRGRVPLFLGALLAATILLPLTPLALPLSLWLVALMLLLMTATALNTLTDSLAADNLRSKGVGLLATYTLAQDLGAAVGPAFGYGLPLVHLPIDVAFPVCAALLLLLGVVWVARSRNSPISNNEKTTKPL
ncbi:MAG TPA: MFS transporter [Bacilli bacterium]|nr:MFS transporter [Bacilli bacterium]